jgi:hypothetical protein
MSPRCVTQTSLDHPWIVQSSTLAACSLTRGLPLATLDVKDFRDFAEHEGLSLIIR